MALERTRLLAAFDRIGAAALANNRKLDLAIYGGSALLLASNFRFATEDVDVADVSRDMPSWLRSVIDALSAENDWATDWLNDAVTVHLSPLASSTADHSEFGSFPRGVGPYGLVISVPSAEYLLALKLKAIRVLDPAHGEQEASDIVNLMKVAGISSIDEALDILRHYFPNSASEPQKHVFLLKRMSLLAQPIDAPEYPLRSR